MAVTIYHEKDANPSSSRTRKVAIIGYGSQGHAHALNLLDSGVDVRVGLREDSKSRVKAEEAGLKVMSVADAAEEADFIMILTPDETQAATYEAEIAPHLKPGDTLAFAHGFNIHFGYITPPEDVDVVMIAPKGPGHMVRRVFTEGAGVPCLICVNQTRRARPRMWRCRTRGASAARAPASSRPRSRTRPKPTCSASRPCCAAA